MDGSMTLCQRHTLHQMPTRPLSMKKAVATLYHLDDCKEYRRSKIAAIFK